MKMLVMPCESSKNEIQALCQKNLIIRRWYVWVCLFCRSEGIFYSQILSNRVRGCSKSSVPFTVSFFRLWSPGGAVVKNPPANAGDSRHMGFNSWLGRSPGTGNGKPLQYSCLGHSRSKEPGMGYCPWDY